MLKKIYSELVTIRKELQAINKHLESTDDFVSVREPYSTHYAVVKVGRERSRKNLSSMEVRKCRG